MTLVTLLLINVTDSRGRLYRVEDVSYPEKQAYEWHTRSKVNTKDVSNFSSEQVCYFKYYQLL